MHTGKPNYQEYGSAGQDAKTDATELYDRGHGKYKDVMAEQTKPTKPPPAQPNPIK